MLDIPSTMHDQITQMTSLDLNYRIMHPICYLKNEATDETIVIPFSSYTNKYRNYLSSIIVYIPLNHEQQLKYRFKPKLISMELYGTTEFWNDILVLNHCSRVCDFKPKRLYVYDPAEFKAYLNQILILEEVI